MCPLQRQPSIDCKEDGGSQRSPYQCLSPRHAIGKSDTGSGSNSRHNGASQVQNELLVGVVPSSLVNFQVEVTEAVTGELSKTTHEDDHQGPPAGILGLEAGGVEF